MKTQILREAKFSLQKSITQKRRSPTRSAILGELTSATVHLENLSESDRDILYNQVKKSLYKERRRALARTGTYDMGRHLNLYILAKILAKVKK